MKGENEMTKEEYKKNLIRYFDSVREGKDYMGTALCCGVACTTCIFAYPCVHMSSPENALDYVELLEQWKKERPVITNKEKFEQIFGIKVTPADCPPASTGRCGRFISCDAFGDCDECKKWWNGKYKEPNGEVTG